MDDVFVWSIDILRVVKNFDKPFSIETLAKSYYNYNNFPEHLSSEIRQNYIDNNLGKGIEENDSLFPMKENIEIFLRRVTTPEYLLDRCIDLLKEENSPVWVTKLLKRQNLTLTDSEIKLLEAKLSSSDLVDKVNGGNIHPAFKVNSMGLISLSIFEKYSDYLKDKAKQEYEKLHRKDSGTTIHVGRDMVSSPVIQDSRLEESPIIHSVKTIPKTKEATATWYTSPIFIYFVWPIAAALVATLLAFKFGWL
jgi:hypothetical protein